MRSHIRADKKFTIGMRVRSTREYLWGSLGRFNLPRHGLVVGFNRSKTCVRVQWDGIATAYSYHPDFIEEAPPAEIDYQI